MKQSSPDYVIALENIYGPPSQAGFGSAVFYEKLSPKTELTATALKYYRYFVGELWARYGETRWMSQWKEVYTRKAGADIVREISAITDGAARQSLPLLFEVNEGAQSAEQALSMAYDDVSVTKLSVYNLGDGGAMSGLLIAGRRQNGETVIVVCLLD
ncbi:MAG: hypothetical protein GC158_09585 [Cyanobacteria bacterium RI_101]|nr:hypothetical protein [Cyanobacteria bacterium RI_101]